MILSCSVVLTTQLSHDRSGERVKCTEFEKRRKRYCHDSESWLMPKPHC